MIKSKDKSQNSPDPELLFADDAALVSHTADELQELLNRFSYACKEFGLTISIKKTKVMG